ncbi:hypothetical protein CHUAL_010882 [Chamberlinius hualienensis]
MDNVEAELFCQRGKDMIDYVTQYMTNLRSLKVIPNVEQGYLRQLLPSEAPEEPDKWEDVMRDVDQFIMPGISHHESPRFHSFFPMSVSHPSMCAEILSNAINSNGINWSFCPAATELEVIVLDWLGQLLQLPKEFLSKSGGKGGGVIQSSASETTLMCMFAAKSLTISRHIKLNNGHAEDVTPHSIWAKLVAYTSDQAHSSVERAGLFVGVEVRFVKSDNNCSMRGEALEEAIAKDKAEGKIPFMLVATLGSTATLGFDNLLELGPIVQRENMWMHIDAAYAGSAFICAEFRHLLDGIEYADSFNFNPHKWLLVNFDCSTLWVKNSQHLTEPFMVNPTYLQDSLSGPSMPDYRHWQIPLSRRFRALKLWFVLRLFGAKYLRQHIIKQIKLAKMFERYVRADARFEVVYSVVMGVVCFRLKSGNEQTETLLKKLQHQRQLYLNSTVVKGDFLIRFVIVSPFTEPHDITYAWNEIFNQCDITYSPIKQNGYKINGCDMDLISVTDNSLVKDLN